MNFSFYVAKRYFFSKKSHNAINIISLITACCITIATLAAVCVLSIFNGFQGLISNTFSSFDPELKITPIKGKVFNPTNNNFLKIYKLPEIAIISETLEDNVLIKYQERQIPIMIKGVSNNFKKIILIKNILFDGEFKLMDEVHSFAVLGIGVAGALGINASFIFPLNFYAPNRNNEVNYFSNPISFNQQCAYISGIFMINQSIYDDNYVIVPINFARRLLGYQTKVSALEIRLKNNTNISSIKKKIQQILQRDYFVKDRYEQQQAAFNMIRIEKWITFLLLFFILLIAAFNLVGSLAMLIVDKKKDIDTLRFLGADSKLVTRIFLFEGWLITIFGCLIGIILGIIVCLGQQHFGWIHLESNNNTFVINAYPIRIEIVDLVLIFFTVLIVSLLPILYPIIYHIRKKQL